MTACNLPVGVIFDMDGVLVDSEEFIAKAACMMFEQKGLKVTQKDFEPFIGTGEDRYIGGVAEKHDFPLDLKDAKTRVYDIYLEIIKGALEPLPGALKFLKQCRQLNKKIALATSADLRKAEGNMTEIGLSLTYFDAVVTAEDAKHKKPDPEIFLVAAGRLGLEPGECLVIEDSITGVAAAKTAGTRCLAITSTFITEQLDGADYFARNLAQTNPEVLNW